MRPEKNLICLFIIVSCIAIGCADDEVADPYQYRKAAWQSLSELEKSTVIVDWQDAALELTLFDSKKAIAVEFRTNQDHLLGPIIIFLNPITKRVLGKAGRD
jgi:hypothetical protein